MGLYGVVKSVGMGRGALWGREVSGNGEWGSMGSQNQWEWGVGLYGVVKSVGLEVGLYGVMKSVGMGRDNQWGHEVSGNGEWGSMGS